MYVAHDDLTTAAMPHPAKQRPVLLCVDDYQPMLETLKAAFSKDYQVDVADSVEACWQALQRRRPDLVILDVQLRVGNGLDLCTALKHSTATSATPVLMYTSESNATTRIEAEAAGAAGLISKQQPLSALQAAVRRHIG